MTKLLIRTALLLYIAAAGIVAGCTPAATEYGWDEESFGPDSKAAKVLFIGSSYFSFNDLPGLLKGLADSAGKQFAFACDVINGTYLDDHARSAATAEMIRKASWDYILLQDAGPPVAYPETHESIVPPYIRRETRWALAQLKEMARQNNDKTSVIFLMPWAFEDGLTWIKGQTDTYGEMQQKIYMNTLAWAREIDFVVAPVGWVWKRVISERPMQHYLFLSDFNHPSYRGSYLTACVLYATMFKENLAGNKFRGALSPGEAEYFRQVASQMVLDSLGLWNNQSSRH